MIDNLGSIDGLIDNDRKVLKVVAEAEPEGIGFNELVRTLDGEMTRPTISNRLTALQDEYDTQYVTKTPEDATNGTPVTYKLAEGGKDFERMRRRLKAASITWLLEAIDYIEALENGDMDEEEFTTALFETHLAKLPRQVLGSAYVWSHTFDDEYFGTRFTEDNRRIEELLIYATTYCWTVEDLLQRRLAESDATSEIESPDLDQIEVPLTTLEPDRPLPELERELLQTVENPNELLADDEETDESE